MRIYAHLTEKKISTHAPRTGSDKPTKSMTFTSRTFQPTLPARGATFTLSIFRSMLAFQPTLPARGATNKAPDRKR